MGKNYGGILYVGAEGTMPRYGDQEDMKLREMTHEERAVIDEAKLEKLSDTLIAYQQMAQEAKENYDKELSKERAERRDAESRAFRAETALQEVLKFITKK